MKQISAAIEDAILSAQTCDRRAVNAWLDSLPSDETRRSYAREAAAFLRSTGKPIEFIDQADLRAFESKTAERPAATVRRIAAALRSLFSFTRSGFENDVRLVPKRGETAGFRGLLSEGEIRRLIDAAAPGRDRLICRALYGTALNPQELSTLRWGDLRNMPDGPAFAVFAPGGTPRFVAIKSTLYQSLLRFQSGARENERIFRVGARQIRRIVKDAGVRAGLPAHTSPATLRLAHAVHAIANGCPVTVVERAVGYRQSKRATILARDRGARGGSAANLHVRSSARFLRES